MLPFFPPHLYKAAIDRSADPFSVHPLMGLDRPSGGIALFLCLDKTPKSYFERATLKEKCSLIQWPLAIVKRISALCTSFFYRDEIFIFTRLFIFRPESFLNKINKGRRDILYSSILTVHFFHRFKISSFGELLSFLTFLTRISREGLGRLVLRVEIREWREQHPAAICAKIPQPVQPLISSLAKSARQSSIKYIVYLKFAPFRGL